MKKIITALLVLTLLSVQFLTGCTTGSSKDGKDNSKTAINDEKGSGTQETATEEAKEISGTVKVSLTADWMIEDGLDPVSGAEAKGLNSLLKESFYKKFPKIKLDISTIPWENAKAKQTALLMSNDVDVFYTAGSWAGQYDAQGLLRYIDDLIANDKTFDPAMYAEGLWKENFALNTVDGKHKLGLPNRIGQKLLIYDKQIFDDWGVPYLSENPTPAEVLEKAQKMTGKNPRTGKQNYGLYINGKDTNIVEFTTARYYFNASICEVPDPKDYSTIQWKLNSLEMVKVFEWLRELPKYAPPAYATGGGMEKFATEDNDVAIFFNANGTLIMGQYRATGKTGMIERFVPVMHIGPEGASSVACDPILMAKNPENLEASWEVMKFLASYDLQKWWYKNLNWTPSLKSADFLDGADVYVKRALQYADKSRSELSSLVPFVTSEVTPFVLSFYVDAGTKRAWNIKDKLDELNKKAEDWSKTQK